MSRYACECCGVDGVTEIAKEALKDLERVVGTLAITSAFRCKEHNDKLIEEWSQERRDFMRQNPGKKFTKPQPAQNSKHTLGLAFDILCKSDDSRVRLLKTALECGFMGFGMGSNFVHIDIREKFAMWHY